MAELLVYVDNVITIGPKEEDCWEASRRWGSVCTQLGIKYELRKAEPPYQQPGTWEGTVTHTEKVVLGMVNQEKWQNTQSLTKEVREMLDNSNKNTQA